MKFFSKLLVVLFILGLVLLGTGVALGFDFDSAVAFLEDDREYTLEEPIIISDDVSKLEIDFDIRNIIVVKSNDDEDIRIEHYSHTDEEWVISVNDGTLKVGQKFTTYKRFINIIPRISSGKQDVYFYIPETLKLEYVIKVATGNVKLENLAVTDLNITSNTGNIILNNLTIDNNLFTKNHTGNTTINDCNITNNVTISATTGNVKLDNVNANMLDVKTTTGNALVLNSTSNEKIDISATTGNVTVKAVVAPGYNLKTSTGNIYFTYHELNKLSLDLRVSTGRIRIDGSNKGKEYQVVGFTVSLTAKASTGNINLYSN